MFRGSGAATPRALERIPPARPPSCPDLPLCGQIGCCIPRWALSTTAMTSSTRASRGDAESAGMGRCHGQSPIFEVMGRLCAQVEGKLPASPLPPIVSLHLLHPPPPQQHLTSAAPSETPTSPSPWKFCSQLAPTWSARITKSAAPQVSFQ